MKVLTKLPVFINKKRVTDSDLYMNFDANGKPTTETEWKMFQTWHNKKGYTPALTEDGKAGPKTNTAWSKYSTGFISDVKAVAGFTATVSGGEPTPQQKAEMTKKGFNWDKAKGWIEVGAKAGKESGFFDALLNKVSGTTPTETATTTTTSTDVVGLKTQTQIDEEDKKKKQKTLIIIGSIAAVALIGIVLLVRKNPETAKAK